MCTAVHTSDTSDGTFTFGIDPPETATLNTPRACTDSVAIAPIRRISSVASVSGLEPTSRVVVIVGKVGLRNRCIRRRSRSVLCLSPTRRNGVGEKIQISRTEI